MKTITLNQLRLQQIIVLIILLSLFKTSNVLASNISYVQRNYQLPAFLVGTYYGNLINKNTITTEGSCTIKYNRNSNYTLFFSNGIKSIRNVKFSKNDDTYIATFLYNEKTFSVMVDEDGDLVINATSGYSNILSFSGEIGIANHIQNNISIITNNDNQNIETNNNNVFIQNGNQTINNHNSIDLNNENQTIETSNETVFIQNENQTINVNDNETHISNGNVSISTDGNGININGSISINHNTPNTELVICSGWTNCTISNCNHENAPQYYYDCGSYEIVRLPQNAIGFYKGKLNGYRIDTKKGLCKIVETGCKTYRLDFSNNIPSIHGVQFGRKNNFEEYTSLVIEGQYSAALEIDMSFKDLSIDGKIMTIDFDGDKQ